jgi:chromate transporter
MMGIMQAELQQRRQWVSKERFLEGISVVNMLPGATVVQLGIFLGYARAGWWGGLLGGLCFILPAFVIMLALTLGYASLGVSPLVRGALYGLGPVVLAIFAVAVYRLGRTAATTVPQVIIALLAAAASLGTPLGVGVILVLAGAAGVLIFHSRKLGAVVAVSSAALIGVIPFVWWSMSISGPATKIPRPESLLDIAAYFAKVGALTVGGGLTMIAFMQDQIVGESGWLTNREFIDGLALGQFTPGPILMVAAYVGYKVAGFTGATVAAAAIFLPSFIMTLAILPVLDRFRKLGWMRAVMKGMAPAVIGLLAVSLVRLAPHAVPDPVSIGILAAALVIMMATKVSPFYLVIGGAILGVLRTLLSSLPGLGGA